MRLKIQSGNIHIMATRLNTAPALPDRFKVVW
jgi:hypothetical protein